MEIITAPPKVSTVYEKRWAALFLLCTAQFMVIMDTSIIGVALPTIKDALSYSQSGLQWIFNAYVIFFGGLLLLGGKLSDLLGARKVFMWGFAMLTASSLLAGLAWDAGSMNTGRALQGLGSAFIAPAALTLVMSMFQDPKELGKALGFWGASAAAGGSAGVFLGGVITEWLSWRWVFLINIPMGLTVLAYSKRLLLTGSARKGRIDFPGALLITGFLVLTVYAIVSGSFTDMSSSTSITMLSAIVGLLLMFIIVQKSRKEPLVPFSVFKVPNLGSGNIVMALMAAAWIPLWFFLNLYLQQILRFSAFQSGLALLPMTIAIMLLMVGFTGKLIGKFGFKPNLVAGLLFLAGSLLLFSTVPVEGSFMLHVFPASLLGAIGMSLAYIPGTMAAMSGARPEETGLASGLVNTSYQIGSALGLAVIVAMSAGKTAVESAAGAVEKAALNAGFQSAFLAAGIVSIVAALLAAFWIKKPRQA
jgi:EmrB/QacA subfamily drug resistance transporter